MARVEKNDTFRQIRDEAAEQGWIIERTTKGRWVFKPPNGETPVFSPGSLGDHRALKNFVAAMRQRGFRPRRQRKRKR